MQRRAFMAMVIAPAGVVALLWAFSAFGGIGFDWHRDTPIPGGSQRTTLNVDIVNGQLIVRHETLSPGPVTRLPGPKSDWSIDLYRRGEPLYRGVAAKPPIGFASLYVPDSTWLPHTKVSVVAGATDFWASLPLYLLFLILAAPPAAAYVRGPLRRRLRIRRGQCPTCGYNLSGLTSGRCPECGGTVCGTERALSS